MRWALVIFVLFFVLLTWMPQLRASGSDACPGTFTLKPSGARWSSPS